MLALVAECSLSGCGEPGLLPSCVYRLLSEGDYLVAENRLQGVWVQSLWHTGSVTLCVWALLRPGIKPVSLALQGAFLTTGPPGKPPELVLRSLIPFEFSVLYMASGSLHTYAVEVFRILFLLPIF